MQDGDGFVKRLTNILVWLLAVSFTGSLRAQVQIGDNTHLTGGGTVNVGYSGNYGDNLQSSHGLTFGFGGGFDGYYYKPNFINFNITPYYNQSRADSSYQSLTNASGVSASANIFTGSHFPGSVSYHYDYNSTGTFGLSGTPNFTTTGNGQGVGINWSALFPKWPTLSVGYQHGSGNGTLYGTNEETSSSTNILNVRSSYQWAGFNMNAYYDHNSVSGFFPEVLTGSANFNNSSGFDAGASTSRSIPFWNGSFYASYSHTSYKSDFVTGSEETSNNSDFIGDLQSAGASFRPTERVGLYVNENYTNNLSSYFLQNLGPNNPPLPGFIPSLGSNSYSFNLGAGASYQFTPNLNGNLTGNRYSQQYLGHSYAGTLLIGNLNYTKKFLDTFTFSAGFVDGTTNFNNNNIGFIGTVNGFHRIGQWQLSGTFTWAQNVQSQFITYTTSYFNYSANLHRRFSRGVQWTAAFNGGHTGFVNGGSYFSTENVSTSLSLRQVALTANYGTGSGNSLLTATGIVPLPPVPGEQPSNLISYTASNYGGGISWTPIRRMVLTGTYSRSLSDTLSNGVFSKNNTEVLYSQLQYRLRRISVLAGYTKFTQGISASGQLPGTTNSYYGGISRWFDFF